MDLTAVAGAYEGLKAIYNGVKGLAEIKEEFAVKARTSELLDMVTTTQGKLFEIQAMYATVASRVGELEAEIMKLEQWSQEQARYALHELVPGTLVYRIKPAMQDGEPVHDLCPNCYQQGVKSILQNAGVKDLHKSVRCPKCSAQFMGERLNVSVGVTIDPEPMRRDIW